MLIKFTETAWLNIDAHDVRRVDIDSSTAEDLTTTLSFFVCVTCNDGTKETSDDFKTIDEARACAENLVRQLNKED